MQLAEATQLHSEARKRGAVVIASSRSHRAAEGTTALAAAVAPAAATSGTSSVDPSLETVFQLTGLRLTADQFSHIVQTATGNV